MKNRAADRQQGFTLIEVMVAVAISLVIATLSYGFLSSAITAKDSSDEALVTVNQLETVFQLLATDLHHVVDRDLPSAAVGLGSEDPAPAFMGGDSTNRGANYLLGDYVLRFARDGWANPLQQPRSDLQRVGYRWFDGQLWRDYWPERNQPLDEEPTGQRLLIDDVKAIRIRFLPFSAKQVNGAAWQNVWPPQEENQQAANGVDRTLPAAVEITLTMEEVGDVQRIISLPGV